MSAKVYRLLTLASENGPDLREPYSKHLEDVVFEFRAKAGTGISRVLYFFFVDRHIVLINGFTKKTQKTPKAAIEKAKAYRKQFMDRKGGGKHENP